MHPEIKKLSPKKLEARIKEEEERLARMREVPKDLGLGWPIAADGVEKELKELKEYAAEKAAKKAA